MSEHKDFVRRNATRHRDSIKVDPDWSEKAADHFFEVVALADSAVVAVYYPIRSEIDPSVIVERLWQQGITVCLPIVQEDGRSLRFCVWGRDSGLVPGKMGILEPFEKEYVLPDVLIVPLLAFDQCGYRLGYGMGHYDATIKQLQEEKPILKVGLAYAEQACLLALPREDHDEPLDLVVTEQRVFDFRGRNT
jgi:5-formyltetrahydrofolate cyclo-ligase